MNQFSGRHVLVCLAICFVGSSVALGQANPNPNDLSTIFGIVMELRSGTPDVPVCLCDAATGIPLSKHTYKPVNPSASQSVDISKEMAIVVTDAKGAFRFEKVPAGTYRLIAQKWIGPYKGIFENHGTVIQLMGVADGVVVPRPNDYYKALVALSPPGQGVVHFDQDVGNSSTIMFLSTQPPEFDPILGLNAMGNTFRKNLLGLNRMPLGKTTVIGAPHKESMYAFFVAPDNSPGFATSQVPLTKSGFIRMPKEPFVAGWSNARKTPPPKIAQLIKLMDEHSLTSEALLKIPELSNANYQAYQARMKELMNELSETIDLVDGKSARVGDIMAADAYRRLQK